MNRSTRLIFLLLSFLAIAWHSSSAGGVLKVEGKNTVVVPVAVEVRTDVRDQIATTVLRATFTNRTGASAKMAYLFPMGLNAAVTQFRWLQNGVWTGAALVGKPQDTAAASGGGNVAADTTLRNYLGGSPFIFPFSEPLPRDSTITVELTYMELLKYSSRQIAYPLPLNWGSYGKGKGVYVSFLMNITTAKKLVAIGSTTHPDLKTEFSEHTASAAFETRLNADASNLLVAYEVAQDNIDLTLLSAKPDSTDGYFIMLAEPNPRAANNEIISKAFTFVIDISGSMGGEKLVQAKEAARYCIQHLNAQDQFNIIPFNEQPTTFRSDPIPATAENIAQGLEFIKGLRARGGTNIQDALLLALGQQMSPNTAKVIIFLTDGIAPVDQQKIQHANNQGVRIHVFGIGRDVDKTMLTQLAANHDGVSDFLDNDSVSNRIGAFYQKIKDPLLQNISVSFTHGDVYDLYPLALPDLYVGEQLVVVGRYRDPGESVAHLHGRSVLGQEDLAYNVTFVGDGNGELFVPKIWAKHRMDALLVLMAGVKENSNEWKEYRGEIIRLSLKYGILSPYSSFAQTENPPADTTGTGGGNGGGNNGGGNNGGGTSSALPDDAQRSDAGLHISISPHPITTSAQISFTLPELPQGASVRIELLDLAGQVVATLALDESPAAGPHTVVWDATANGAYLPSGAYLLRFTIGEEIQTRLVIVQR